MKLQCKICESTDLSYQNNSLVCNQCGCKYSVEEAKKLISDNPTQITPTTTIETPANSTPRKTDVGQIVGWSILLLISIAILCAFLIVPSLDGINSNAFKQKPTITYKETLYGFDFYVECNDNYSVVEIEATLSDKNGNIVDTITLSGTNYKKGNTYTLSYKIDNISSLVDALKSYKISYRITKYK